MSQGENARPRFSAEELVGAAGEALFAMTRPVRFQEVDAAGTIYFARVLEYFGDAYVGLLGARGIDLPALLDQGSVVAPLAHAEADYLLPLRFGDETRVEVVATHVGETSIRLGYRARDPSDATRVHAVGQTAHVFVDRRTFKKCPVPPAFRAALAR